MGAYGVEINNNWLRPQKRVLYAKLAKNLQLSDILFARLIKIFTNLDEIAVISEIFSIFAPNNGFFETTAMDDLDQYNGDWNISMPLTSMPMRTILMVGTDNEP